MKLLFTVLIGIVAALDNGLARLPPMGWMSWTAFYCEMDCVKHPKGCINENLYMDMADRMAQDGYREAGYLGVHIDDCWMEHQRNPANGRLVANQTRFPSGMKTLAKYMHDRGLKFGIYEDYGTKTCAGFPGSYMHLKVDAQTFADWDVDYLKLDGCNIELDLMPIGYPEMGRELNATGRPMIYSCSWPAYLIDQPQKVDYNVIGKHCNTWRNFDDINSSWKSIISIIAYYDVNQDKHIPTHGPGKWHDPDMLVIGNAGITVSMARAQMTIWSIWSAPLIMSNDLRTIGKEFRDILLNRRVIAIDQDPMGVMGRLVGNTTDLGVYIKPITTPGVTPTDPAKMSYAVAILNRNPNKDVKVNFKLADIGLRNPAGYNVDNIWANTKLGKMNPDSFFSEVVNAADAILLTAYVADPQPTVWDFFRYGMSKN